MPSTDRRIAVIGLGLIGGSIARALRQNLDNCRIIGYSLEEADAQAARDCGALDLIADSPEQAVRGADIAVLATPPASIAGLMQTVCQANPDVLITDTGSIKQAIADEVSQSPFADRIVPAHPIAGTQHSGFAASDADLFQGKILVLTPLDGTPQPAIIAVRQFWQLIGCRILQMTPDQHDRIFAGASHLPHLVAWALMATIGQNPDAESIRMQGAGGLKDFTRVAASDPELWAQIFTLNRRYLEENMTQFARQFEHAAQLVREGKQEELRQWLQQNRAEDNAR